MPSLRTCPCCGLAQLIPPVPADQRACCCRCGTGLRAGGGSTSGSRTAALATAALILYPMAVSLPLMSINKFGHSHEAGILEGTAQLLASGQLFIGTIVLLCSVIIPLTKLAALLLLSAGAGFLGNRHRALTYHLIEWTGRWGMLDVLLVAILVAILKLGDVVAVQPGPGAAAFAGCVVLSLLATASFDPHYLWNTDPRPQPRPRKSPGTT